MKRNLTRQGAAIWHFVDGEREEGAPEGVTGDLSGVSGDLSGVRGDLSGVRGDLSGVSGNLSRVWGDLDECGLTPEDRAAGVDISLLIREGE